MKQQTKNRSNTIEIKSETKNNTAATVAGATITTLPTKQKQQLDNISFITTTQNITTTTTTTYSNDKQQRQQHKQQQ